MFVVLLCFEGFFEGCFAFAFEVCFVLRFALLCFVLRVVDMVWGFSLGHIKQEDSSH